MALGAEVVNLIELHLLDDPDQVGAVGLGRPNGASAAAHFHAGPDRNDRSDRC